MERDPCFFGNKDYSDSSKVHIADTSEEYQDWQSNVIKILGDTTDSTIIDYFFFTTVDSIWCFVQRIQ